MGKNNEFVDENVEETEDLNELQGTFEEDEIPADEIPEEEESVETNESSTEETETSDETPADNTSDKPAETDAPSTEKTETPDTGDTKPGDTKPVDKTPADPVPPKQEPVVEPVVEEKPAVTLSSVYSVRYHIVFAQKRMAIVRQMPIYNMLSTWCFNKSSFIGCTSKKDYAEIEGLVKSLPENKVRVDGILVSEAAKEQFLIKLKANTDYCVLKWGDKRK